MVEERLLGWKNFFYLFMSWILFLSFLSLCNMILIWLIFILRFFWGLGYWSWILILGMVFISYYIDVEVIFNKNWFRKLLFLYKLDGLRYVNFKF